MVTEGRQLLGWLRRPPTIPAGPEIKNLFFSVAADPRFQRVAGLSETELASLHQELERAEFCYCNILQGGYAGRPPGRGLVLGLSSWHIRRAPAVHELLHVAREVRGLKRLDDETKVWREEFIVWYQTLQHTPVLGTIEMVVLLTILHAVVFGVVQLGYWLLGI